MSKLTKIVIAVAVAVAAVIAVIAIPKIIAAIRDDDDLVAELPDATTSSSSDGSGSETTDISTETTDATETTDPAAGSDRADGSWTAVPGDRDTYFVGYQIEETLRGAEITATGTTGDYTGSLTIAGTTVEALSLNVDMTTLQSDEDRRDDSIRSDGLETDDFPEATFIATAPITLPDEAVVGTPVTVEVTGDLTLHGVTNTVTFTSDARWNGDTIDITGEISIALSDYDIAAPSRTFVSVRDTGKVVFVVQFARA